jgi:hypothetical protein
MIAIRAMATAPLQNAQRRMMPMLHHGIEPYQLGSVGL